jgi:hypothetical protein
MPELPVVRSMIKALKWRSIAIFYETSTGKKNNIFYIIDFRNE